MGGIVRSATWQETEHCLLKRGNLFLLNQLPNQKGSFKLRIAHAHPKAA